ncbi:MAG: SPL family radical SAM protein [Thermacetogeniaceae bacterium]|nr:radical SAM protein [Thermoanaerobacterales bacterium]NLN20387.1 radical SAM protein [Syntrophomonadaceae bacterium]HAF17991.1 radical SAM protein [Peptococcaceae bacterium]
MLITEKECRTALNRCGIPGIDYCLNPYTGCSHGCLYCYASFMKKFCNISGEWGSFIQVKVNFAERLQASLKRRKQGCVTLSSVTDPYQPVERRYRLTRSCLELLTGTDLSVNILTKSDLVLRDLDLLKKLPQVKVGLTITTTDPYVAKLLEPSAPSPERRLQALAQLAAAGIRTWVFIAPVVPGLADTRENLSSILKKAAAAGVREIDYDPLNFYPAAVSNMREVFKKHWPRQRPIFEAACREPYYYKQHLRSLAEELLAQYGYE